MVPSVGVADVLGAGADVDRLSQIGAPEDDAGDPAAAGRSVISTFLPVCSPTPVARMRVLERALTDHSCTDLAVRAERRVTR